MTRPVYAYRLVVEYPEGIDWRNPPEGWTPQPLGPDDETQFSWPRNRSYLSLSGATNRARLFREYGCTVTIERSNEITWSA